MGGKAVLLIEDNKRVNAFNKRLLEKQGFTVDIAATLAQAWEALSRFSPNIIVLDIGMPDGNGLDFLRELRLGSQVPVLLLTGNNKNADIELGFKSGCNDYLPKPYGFGVLLARLNNILQSTEKLPDTLDRGLLHLNMIASQAFLRGMDMVLTQKEFALLLLLVKHENQAMSAEYLYEKAWGQPMNKDNQAVRTAVSRLRAKLKGSGFALTNRAGEGYCFSTKK